MPALLAFLGWLLFGGGLAAVIFRMLFSFGVGVVVLGGVSYGLDLILTQFENSLSGVPNTALQLIKISGFLTILYWYMAAYAVRAAVRLLKVFMARRSTMASVGNLGA